MFKAAWLLQAHMMTNRLHYSPLCYLVFRHPPSTVGGEGGPGAIEEEGEDVRHCPGQGGAVHQGVAPAELDCTVFNESKCMPLNFQIK